MLRFVILIISTSIVSISATLFSEVSLKRVNNTVCPSKIFLYFYNQQYHDEGIRIELANFTGIINANEFDPTLDNYYITHGSNADYTSVRSFKHEILSKQAANVFLIDWSAYSRLFYTIAVTSVPQVGPIVGMAIERMLISYNMSYASMKLIGHSLGAHVMGATGQFLRGNADYIVGLDPTGPLFENSSPDKRLDATDAQFVQILHTNGGFQGIRAAIGHADYFPNGGGMNQPGCGVDLFGKCAHARAPSFYKESLSTRGFIGRACSSYDDYAQGLCVDNGTSSFGGLPIDKAAHGEFYFDTNSASPFATGQC